MFFFSWKLVIINLHKNSTTRTYSGVALILTSCVSSGRALSRLRHSSVQHMHAVEVQLSSLPHFSWVQSCLSVVFPLPPECECQVNVICLYERYNNHRGERGILYMAMKQPDSPKRVCKVHHKMPRCPAVPQMCLVLEKCWIFTKICSECSPWYSTLL